MAFGDGIRRNIASVAPTERALLRDALIELNRRFFPGNKTDPIPGGVSWWFKQDEIHQATHVHHGPEFLPWHREIVNRLEQMLREINPQLSLHYWDWTQDPRAIPQDGVLPDALNGAIPDPLNLFSTKIPFMGYGGSTEDRIGQPWQDAGFYVPGASPDRDSSDNPADPPSTVTRSVGSLVTKLISADEEAAILSEADYARMHKRLEDAHDSMHGFVFMGGKHISFRDPFVFLLHSNVDRLFALWQTDPAHPERLDPIAVYGSESNLDVKVEKTIQNLNHNVEPWSTGLSVDELGEKHSTRPWCDPEKEGVRHTYKHPSVVFPPRYDTNRPMRSPRVPATAEVNAVSRSVDKLDIFVTDKTGAIYTALWERTFADWWHGWYPLLAGSAAPGAPVHATSRGSSGMLDVFAIGTDTGVYTASWEFGFTDWWGGWWHIQKGSAAAGAHVTAIWKEYSLHVFAIGKDGRVYTSVWSSGLLIAAANLPTIAGSWSNWTPVGDIRVPAGSRVQVVSSQSQRLDIFVTDVNGDIQTASLTGDPPWTAWEKLKGGRAAPGAPVIAVSRSWGRIDVFVVGTDGRVFTIAALPIPPFPFILWSEWQPIGDLHAPAGAPVHTVSRSSDKLDIFVTDVNGDIRTAAWEPAFTDGWHGWWNLNGGSAAPGAPVTAVSRSADKLDVFVVGTDGRVFTAAWEPGFTDGWHGWWSIGE